MNGTTKQRPRSSGPLNNHTESLKVGLGATAALRPQDIRDMRSAKAKRQWYEQFEWASNRCHVCDKKTTYTWIGFGFCSTHRAQAIAFKAAFPTAKALERFGLLREAKAQ